MEDAEIEGAEVAGTAELLAIDGVVLPEPNKFTADELAAKVGAEIADVRTFWRALGFVDPVEGERSFNRRDVAILKSLVSLSRDGLIDRDVSLQVARVLGLSMAQVATAVVDASENRSVERSEQLTEGDEVTADEAAGSLAVRAGELLPFLTDVMDYSFRRHLRAAARRRVVLAGAVGGSGQVIGFADLVRFTELSMQLDDRELARLVGRFDQLVNGVVVRHGGRIVKMIGDAAMFTVLDPVHAALIALELSDAVGGDDVLSGLRIGMASGPILARDGDLYGPVVNMASRLAALGRSGAINVSQDLRNAIAADDRFALRSLGQWKLRHIGDVRVYRLRPGSGWEPDSDDVDGVQPV
jgi:adenylate cyclase